MNGSHLIATEFSRFSYSSSETDSHYKALSVELIEQVANAYYVTQSPDEQVPEAWPLQASDWQPDFLVDNLTRAGALFLWAAFLADKSASQRGKSLRSQAIVCADLIDDYFSSSQNFNTNEVCF